jgi:GSH-dependent disulfide-bond oxidoreductase
MQNIHSASAEVGGRLLIDLHYIGTANGYKPVIMLEEVGLNYNIIAYDMYDGDHLTAEYRKINPNNKLPALVDHDPMDGGPPLPVFESGAMLLYLAEKTGQLIPTDARGRSQVQQWLIWQVAGLGPMMGQAHHFIRYAPDQFTYAVERYTREARRLLNVFEHGLGENDFIAGSYSIADIACFGWISGIPLIGFDPEEWPRTFAWKDRVEQRPAVAAVLASERLRAPSKYAQRSTTMSSDEWSAMFGDRQHAAAEP